MKSVLVKFKIGGQLISFIAKLRETMRIGECVGGNDKSGEGE